ncbi:uncharacterized protein [Blastocystis hominis]|uniref:Uncharacterized protein n=1 Tax=Blastocystis hominis TaxID=12968 RepID=D8M5D2_BLAHO|nr:uncharacterized protein [Blastocystis hominis]CBK23271.2 unnamed protein product [Blastocystis hominis]|eukprot:XP_012897319.1 uncharacterized protein [Blastocystis hominis]
MIKFTRFASSFRFIVATSTHSQICFNSRWRTASTQPWILPSILRCSYCGKRKLVACCFVSVLLMGRKNISLLDSMDWCDDGIQETMWINEKD